MGQILHESQRSLAYQNDIHFAAFTNEPRYLISEIVRNISEDYFYGYMASCGVGLKYN